MWIISNSNRTECSPIRSVIIRVITKSDNRAVEVRFVYYKYDNKLSDKKFCDLAKKKFFPPSYELFRVASAKVPQHYKEQKDYCLILNVTSWAGTIDHFLSCCLLPKLQVLQPPSSIPFVNYHLCKNLFCSGVKRNKEDREVKRVGARKTVVKKKEKSY